MRARRRETGDSDSALSHHRQGPRRDMEWLASLVRHSMQHFDGGSSWRELDDDLLLKPGFLLDAAGQYQRVAFPLGLNGRIIQRVAADGIFGSHPQAMPAARHPLLLAAVPHLRVEF